MSSLDEKTRKTIAIMATDIKYIIQDNERFCKKIDAHEERINAIEKKQQYLRGKLSVVVGMVGLLISVFIGWIFFIWSRIVK